MWLKFFWKIWKNWQSIQRELYCLKELPDLFRLTHLPLKYPSQPLFPRCGVCWERHSDTLCSCCGVCQSLDWAKQGLDTIFSIQMSNAIHSTCSVFLPGNLMLSHKTKYLLSTSTLWFCTWIMLILVTSQNVETWIAFWPSVCWIIGKHFIWF